MFPSPHRPSLASSSNHPHPNNINGVNNNGLNGYHHAANGYAVSVAATRTPEQSPRLRETNANLQQIGRHRDKLELIRNSLRPFEQQLPPSHTNDPYSNGYGPSTGAYDHHVINAERQNFMLNTLTQLGFEREAAFYALKLVKFSSVGAAAELLKNVPIDQFRGGTNANYQPLQYSQPQAAQLYAQNHLPASYYTPQGYNLTTTTTFSAVPGGAPSTQQHITGYRLPPPPPMATQMIGPPPVVGIPHHMIDDSGSSRSDSPAAAPSPPMAMGNGRSSPQANGRGPTVRNHHIQLRPSNSMDYPEVVTSRKVEYPVFQATGGTVINIDNNSHMMSAQKTRAAAKVVSAMKARIPVSTQKQPVEAVNSVPSMGHYRLEQRNSDTSNHQSDAKPQSNGVQSILVDPDNGITDLVDQLRKNQRDSVASATSDGSFMQQLLQEQVVQTQQQQQQAAEEQSQDVVRCVSPIPDSTIQKVQSADHERTVKPCKSGMLKFFMEQHVERLIQQYKERNLRAKQLAKEMEQADLPDIMREKMLHFLVKKESRYIRLKRQKMNKDMFEVIKTIGIGAFGQVSLVKKKDTERVYAMKKLSKKDVIMKQQAAHVKAERDILAEANSSWIVKLYFSFQDSNFLYFILEFVPGGDLMTLLCRDDFFPEKLARFYTAELTCAIEYVHKLGFIHRDIKPDNILIDKDGHIKLTDFGLCTGLRWTHDKRHYEIENDPNHVRQDSFSIPQHLVDSGEHIKLLDYRNHKRRYQAHSVVGTCNYMAPEVIQKTGHTQLCDWWSVGVILYEMVFGRPPFLAPQDNNAHTQQLIIHWQRTLKLDAYLSDPRWVRPSHECIDMIRSFLCDQQDRIGRYGAQEVKQHPWFNGIDFANLRTGRAEVVPKIDHAEDTQNFETFDNHQEKNFFDTISKKLSPQQASNPAFYEFTFRHFFDYDGQGCPSLKTQQRPSLAPLLNSAAPSHNNNNNNNKPLPPSLHDQFSRLHTGDGPNVRNVPIVVQKNVRRGPVAPVQPQRPRFDQFLEEEDSDDSLVV
ncbi:hypothetical protein QR680_010720 [Steinernema hermaphroditum]|uniref:non-specific serine/threonine protein kinase n=1 Tax=Steinernema hermaphroditum TaxID=289476 RepID=A0AA39IPX6_9BILA|nr:hypothetical protein QR680_010720 [Steinernema hermaphroditum]